jgi:hypothetical protein
MHPRRSSSARGVALLVVAAAANVALAGCATFNEPAGITVKNDTADIVTLAVCGSKDCSKHLDPSHLPPGASGGVNVEINSGYGPAIILRSDGSAIGCLPFQMAKRPPQGFSVTVSQAVACGESGGVATANGKDWPDPSL